jgi:hypothetical protein
MQYVGILEYTSARDYFSIFIIVEYSVFAYMTNRYAQIYDRITIICTIRFIFSDDEIIEYVNV